MKLATFNICWLGGDQVPRTEEDKSLIAKVIAKLDADAIVFQEIVDPEVLEHILNEVNDITSRTYRLYDNDRLLGLPGKRQKVVATYDGRGYELTSASPVSGGEGRLPYGLRLRRVTDGAQISIVGVHFQSGYPDFLDEQDAARRRRQCQHLADWVAGAEDDSNPDFPGPLPNEHVVILGDFNALYDSDQTGYDVVVESLDPLREEHMAEWWWEKPLPDPAGGDHSTSYLERLLIDFVMLSPSLRDRIVKPPTIYAFDRDAEIGASGVRISDHRPVVVEIDISPRPD